MYIKGVSSGVQSGKEEVNASAGERHFSPTTSPKSLRNAKKTFFGHFSLKKMHFWAIDPNQGKIEPI